MKKNILLIFIYCFLALNTHAQNKKILDSLNNIYNTAKHDTIKIMALNDIAFEYRGSKPDTCIALAMLALEKSEKIDFERGKGWAMNRIGLGGYNKGKYSDALTYLQKNLVIFEKIRENKGIGSTLNVMGNIYNIQGNYVLALEYQQKSLQINESIGNIEGIAAVLISMGNIYRGQGKYSLALECYQKNLKIRQKIGDKLNVGVVLNNIGNVYNVQGNELLALEYYQKSLKISEETNNKQAISNALGNIGVIYENQNNYSLALEYYQRSLKIQEEIGAKRGMANTLNNIGTVQNKQGNIALALEYYHKSLKIDEETGNKRGMGLTLSSIGNSYAKQGNDSLALEYGQKALKVAEEIGDKRDATYALNSIANTYQKQKNYDKSIEYAQKSLQKSQEMKALKEINNASFLLFEAYKLKGDYVKALEYHELYKQSTDSLFNVDKSKAIANLESKADLERKEKEIAILSKDKELDKQKQEALSKDLALQRIEGERQKNAKLAIEQQAKADRLLALARQEHDKYKQDSLAALAQKAQLVADNLKVNEQKLQAESKTRELEVLKEKEEKEFQQSINYIVLLILLLVIIFAYFLFRSHQKTKKAKKVIEEINNELYLTLNTVNIQKTEIEKKNQHISDSIKYAQRIQQALLPFEENFTAYLGKENFFILYKPKDVVSGDFYFFEEVDNKLVVMAVDCTGHGVPGAFMSMIGINLLEEIVLFQRNTNPSEILTLLHKKTRFVLKQKETQNTDGMDLAMVVIDKEKKIMEFAGAKNSMIYIQNKELYTLKADKMPIGGEQKEEERIFTKQTVDISQPTSIYLFSDGYQDQFGGKNKKKFMVSQMRELFLSFTDIPMSAQQSILDEKIENWRAEGKETQIDDILVLGVKI